MFEGALVLGAREDVILEGVSSGWDVLLDSSWLGYIELLGA